MSKISGELYKGKKYVRVLDFKRDDTKTLIRKAKRKAEEKKKISAQQKEIIEILKAQNKEQLNLAKKLDNIKF